MKNGRLGSIIKYWFKILTCENTKYIRSAYNMMINDIEIRPNKRLGFISQITVAVTWFQ